MVLEKKEGFEKQQLLESKTFRPLRDVAQAVLKEERRYTLEEAKREIKAYLEKKIGEKE